VLAGHHGLAAECVDGVEDALVIGGDDDPADAAGEPDLLDDVLDERFARRVGERLAGEAGGGVPRGDDGEGGRLGDLRLPICDFRLGCHAENGTAGAAIMKKRSRPEAATVRLFKSAIGNPEIGNPEFGNPHPLAGLLISSSTSLRRLSTRWRMSR
jgi:hypothetical protein